jgi:hypothetical protein
LTAEVTIKEIMDKYMISCTGITSTGWTKHIILNDGVNKYSGKLQWDSDIGYTWFSDGYDIPPEASRPEFEYVLDCITEGDR